MSGKLIKVGDVWRGSNLTDMVNNALGTHYKRLWGCTASLERIDAWFVFMDGTRHGLGDGYQWCNTISDDGTIIREEFVGDDKKWGQNAEVNIDVLAFQRDPYRMGDGFLCKFVGKFELDVPAYFKNKFVRIYKKVSDTYEL